MIRWMRVGRAQWVSITPEWEITSDPVDMWVWILIRNNIRVGRYETIEEAKQGANKIRRIEQWKLSQETKPSGDQT